MRFQRGQSVRVNTTFGSSPLISHNQNSSYACSTEVFVNGKLTLLVPAFGGCHDVRHFSARLAGASALIRASRSCYDDRYFKRPNDRDAGFMSARSSNKSSQ